MIDREKLVSKHNPVLKEIAYHSPLSVGNGQIAFTADITGMQTLYDEYLMRDFPLCCMSQWGWNSHLFEGGKSYTYDDFVYTEYVTPLDQKKVKYPVIEQLGNEKVYKWLRKNPHRTNLIRVAMKKDGKKIQSLEISCIHQTLNQWDGILESHFSLDDCYFSVETLCLEDDDVLAWKVESNKKLEGLSIEIAFPYSSFSPLGPFYEHSEGKITPDSWECLDGTLYVEDGIPYMVFCHEWQQIGIGEICSIALAKDLKKGIGAIKTLLKASEPSWVDK